MSDDIERDALYCHAKGYDAVIQRNRVDSKVGDEAWGRWVAGKYRDTGKCPSDPLLAAKQESVSKEKRKTYMRDLMRKKRQDAQSGS